MHKWIILFFLTTVILMFNGCFSPTDPDGLQPLSGTGERIAMKIDVLDDSETRWFFGTRFWATKAELYLKLSCSSIPDIYWLYPLNVGGEDSGSLHYNFTTPFCLGNSIQTSLLTVELLDGDFISNHEKDMLASLSKAGVMLICTGINLYKSQKVICVDQAASVAKCLEQSSKLLIENFNQRKFESFGKRDYIIYKVGHLYVTNPITILDNSNRARADIKIHLIP